MYHSGDKNVNIIELIKSQSGKRYPSGQGIPDKYNEDVPCIEYPRDEREHRPIDVIRDDQSKPLDGADFNTRLKRVENAIDELNGVTEETTTTDVTEPETTK